MEPGRGGPGASGPPPFPLSLGELREAMPQQHRIGRAPLLPRRAGLHLAAQLPDRCIAAREHQPRDVLPLDAEIALVLAQVADIESRGDPPCRGRRPTR